MISIFVFILGVRGVYFEYDSFHDINKIAFPLKLANVCGIFEMDPTKLWLGLILPIK